MARGINKVILVGNVGQDPVVRFTPNGEAVANISLATSEKWKDRQGQWQEKTEWHRIVIFGKAAEIAQQYVQKGSKLYIEGKLQTRKWQDNNGQDRYTTEIVVSGFNGQMQILDKLNEQGSHQYPSQQYTQAPNTGSNHQVQQTPQNQYNNNPGSQPQQPSQPSGGYDDFDDSIPF